MSSEEPCELLGQNLVEVDSPLQPSETNQRSSHVKVFFKILILWDRDLFGLIQAVYEVEKVAS